MRARTFQIDDRLSPHHEATLRNGYAKVRMAAPSKRACARSSRAVLASANGYGWTSVRTGIALEIPDGQAGLVLPRSGLAARHGIALVNSPGLIDSGYRGELLSGTKDDVIVDESRHGSS